MIVPDPFIKAIRAIEELLASYEIDIEDPDVGQNIVNAAVMIDNAYNGFDGDGNKV